MKRIRIESWACVALLVAAGLSPLACGGDGGDTTSSASGSGGAGASGGAGGTGGTGGATASSSSGTGGTGGSGVTCLDPSTHSALFTIVTPELCAVAVYTADEDLGFQLPTWGSHGGPLTLRPTAGADVDLVRWKLPSGTTGALTKQETHLVDAIQDGSFPSAQAVDLPYFGWTALSWSGAFPDTQGEIVMAKGSAIDKRFAVNGAFEFAGIGTDGATGRFLYTGLSAIDDESANENGLYAADTCGLGDLLPGGDPTCNAPIQIAAWGDASGPVAVDAAGNVFAIQSSFSGDQEARGFASSTIAHGGAAAMGDTLFTMGGFGSSLAAIAPDGAAKGILAFQPFDGTTFEALDVVALAYTATATAVTADGMPVKLLQLAAPGTALSLMTDDTERLWVAGKTGMTQTTFVVLARKP